MGDSAKIGLSPSGRLGDSDPPVLPLLKYLQIDPRYQSGGILGNIVIDPDKNHIKNLYHEISRNDPESPTLDPERNFNDPGKVL